MSHETEFVREFERIQRGVNSFAEEIRRFLARYVQRQDKPPKKQRRVWGHPRRSV